MNEVFYFRAWRELEHDNDATLAKLKMPRPDPPNEREFLRENADTDGKLGSAKNGGTSENRTANRKAKRTNKPASLLAGSHAAQRQPITPLARAQLPDAKSFQTILELRQEKRGTKSGDPKRSELNSRIRQERELHRKKVSKLGFQVRLFTDVNGIKIGRVYRRRKSVQPHREWIKVAHGTFVRSIGFDFSSKGKSEKDPHATPVLRVTAFLTNEGRENLARYIKKRLAPKYDQNKYRFVGRQKIRKKDVRNRMKKQRAYDWDVNGLPTHLHLDGKISLFFELQRHVPPLVSQNECASPDQQKRLIVYSEMSPLKKWVESTTPQFNTTVANAFTQLAAVLDTLMQDGGEDTP